MWLPDATVDHLRAVAVWPEFTSDRYEILDAIGRGGMGTVYAALDRTLGREVAIKVGNALASTELQARLTQEARVLARLEHPGIVPVHDAGLLADGRPFYVMKRVHGRTLGECLAAAPPLSERLRIFERVCEAVAFAHAAGIIHRDLKPENVMVGTFGEVMVMDWGAARLLAGAAEPDHDDETAPSARYETASGAVIGTPGFMAPEQRDPGAPVDERTDVYALGALLFTLLAGSPPDADGAAMKVEGVPPALRAICAAALAHRPADRYVNVTQLAGDIASFRERRPVSVHAESLLERTGRFVRAYQVPILLVLAYIVMRALIAVIARI